MFRLSQIFQNDFLVISVGEGQQSHLEQTDYRKINLTMRDFFIRQPLPTFLLIIIDVMAATLQFMNCWLLLRKILHSIEKEQLLWFLRYFICKMWILRFVLKGVFFAWSVVCLFVCFSKLIYFQGEVNVVILRFTWPKPVKLSQYLQYLFCFHPCW